MCFPRLRLKGVAAGGLSLVLAHLSSAQQLRPINTDAPAKAELRFLERACGTQEIDRSIKAAEPAANLNQGRCDARPLHPSFSSREPCASSSSAPLQCVDEAEVLLQRSLEALGKRKRTILGARTRVLDILRLENACSEWFRTRNPDPASAFGTLSFVVDSKAQDYVLERQESLSPAVFVNPYVATAIQDGGEFQTIVLNAGGAFFHSFASLIRQHKEGGAQQFRGARTLKVGPYLGNTLQAQLTTLLHELGHLEGLLPLDTDDANGQSAANTREVIRHCQAEIESPRGRASVLASR